MLPEIVHIVSQYREPYNRHDFNSVFFKLVLFSTAISILSAKVSGHLPPWCAQLLGPLIGLMWAFVSVFILIAIIRRLRHLGWSPWLAIIVIIPLANFVLLMILLFKKGTKKPPGH